jgi:GNAT superfamily N-acetyltransferase
MINIVARDITPAEHDWLNAGFDEQAIEHGVQIQRSDRFGVVALDDERLIGVASGLAYRNGDRYSGWFNLTDLFVEKYHRRQGIGRRLLLSLEQIVAAVDVSRIYTWTAAYEAPSFYTKMGYLVFAELEHWYSTGASRIALRKDLNRP